MTKLDDLATMLATETPLSRTQAEALLDKAIHLGLTADVIEKIIRAHPMNPIPRLHIALQFAEAFAVNLLTMDEPTIVPCGWGCCEIYLDPPTGRITGGVGHPLCGCDNLPGWNSPYLDGMPKPQAPVKARGRHGSRIQRSTARRVEWRRMVAKYESEETR